MTSPVPPAHPFGGRGKQLKDGGPTVIKSFDLGGGQRLVLETRATGDIRLTIEHPGYQQTRANIDPETGTNISQELMKMSFAQAIRGISAHRPGAFQADAFIDQVERGGKPS